MLPLIFAKTPYSGNQQEPFESGPSYHGTFSKGTRLFQSLININYVQVSLGSKPLVAVLPRALPQLEVDPPAAEQPWGQLEDLDVRQHQSQGGVLRRDLELSEIRHQSEPVQHWHCHKEDQIADLSKQTFLIAELAFKKMHK